MQLRRLEQKESKLCCDRKVKHKNGWRKIVEVIIIIICDILNVQKWIKVEQNSEV